MSPDIVCVVSHVSQVLFKDLSALKSPFRHLLQHLQTTGSLALLYLYPRGTASKAMGPEWHPDKT